MFTADAVFKQAARYDQLAREIKTYTGCTAAEMQQVMTDAQAFAVSRPISTLDIMLTFRRLVAPGGVEFKELASRLHAGQWPPYVSNYSYPWTLTWPGSTGP